MKTVEKSLHKNKQHNWSIVKTIQCIHERMSKLMLIIRIFFKRAIIYRQN